MSAVIQQMVMRRRAVKFQIQADILAHDAIVAKARGADGIDGKDGRGIAKLSIERGDLVVTYTDKKKQNVGKVVSEKVVVVAGGGSSGETLVPIEGEQAMYAKRVDFISDNLFYKGEAAPGSSTANPVWRISRTTIGGDGDVTEEWADGSALFEKIWSDRVSYAYV
jgi:hypothetical protein